MKGQQTMDVSARHRIERLAFISVSRACGFAALAILTTFVGLSPMPALAFKACGILTLLLAAVLWLKAQLALAKDCRTTEVWMMLPVPERPTPDVAQSLISDVLHAQFLNFAIHAARFSVAMFAIAALAALIGR
jgi:hypothetical protein